LADDGSGMVTGLWKVKDWGHLICAPCICQFQVMTTLKDQTSNRQQLLGRWLERDGYRTLKSERLKSLVCAACIGSV
jgi:hypothetical protein